MNPLNILQRWWQHLGFGIESRTDYDFLHDVIREKHPYYIYQKMQRAFPKATSSQHRTAQLLFRLGNFERPSEILLYGTPSEMNRYALTQTIVTEADRPLANIIYIEGEPLSSQNLDLHEANMIIATDIDAVNAELWQTVLSLPHSITFDMRHLGIAIIDRKRFTAHYNI